MNAKTLSKELASSMHTYYTYSGHLVGNASDQTPGMCQARCASSVLCSYISFSTKNSDCQLHGRLAQRFNTKFSGIGVVSVICWLCSERMLWRMSDVDQRLCAHIVTGCELPDIIWGKSITTCLNFLCVHHLTQWYNVSVAFVQSGSLLIVYLFALNTQIFESALNRCDFLYNLEAQLLRRWRSEISTFRRGLLMSDARCTRDANLLIVPSLYMHVSRFDEIRCVKVWFVNRPYTYNAP
jgi:hypothetical protein